MFVICSGCGTRFFKETKRINENNKLGRRHFCSIQCLGKSQEIKIAVTCENPLCHKKFEKVPKEVSPHNYCSRSCAVTINNSKYPKHPGIVKQCFYCGKDFKSRAKYCSRKCKDKAHEIPSSKLIFLLKEFYKKNERIPLKREFGHYSSMRAHFGTWNNAIVAAGFDPNPVMFAKKYIAKDGHKCDSLAERIIDDWLTRRGIIHKRSVPYPGNFGFSVDFRVGNYWIEFFGLQGELRRYDELMSQKLKLIKKYKLELIAIYPKDLFPKPKLTEKLEFLINLGSNFEAL